MTSKVFLQLAGLVTDCLHFSLEVQTTCLGINHSGKAKEKKVCLCYAGCSLHSVIDSTGDVSQNILINGLDLKEAVSVLDMKAFIYLFFILSSVDILIGT